jgi:hypothetical protein
MDGPHVRDAAIVREPHAAVTCARGFLGRQQQRVHDGPQLAGNATRVTAPENVASPIVT